MAVTASTTISSVSTNSTRFRPAAAWPSRRRPVQGLRRAPLICHAAVGVFFSTSTGHTEDVAGLIKEEFGDAAAVPADIGDVELSSLAGYDGLVVGAPTWNTGAPSERSGTSWDNILEDIRALDLGDTPVAVFGLGDSISYGDDFCDAMEEIYNVFKDAGGKMVGHWPADGYQHQESKALLDESTFCGLPLDEDNEDDKTAGRVKEWVQQVRKEMSV